jgi:hypothetical protein
MFQRTGGLATPKKLLKKLLALSLSLRKNSHGFFVRGFAVPLLQRPPLAECEVSYIAGCFCRQLQN